MATFTTLADLPPIEPRVPLARVRDGVLELNVYPGGFGSPYAVELDRVNAPEKALRWLRHLAGKTWFTSDLCRDSIDVLSRHFGWAVIGGAL